MNEPNDLRERLREAKLLSILLDDPPRKHVALSMVHQSSLERKLIWKFTVGRMYKSAQEPEVLAMIQQIMDAIFAKFPELKTYPVKILADRKGESTLELAAIRFGMMTSQGDPVDEDEDELEEEDED